MSAISDYKPTSIAGGYLGPSLPRGMHRRIHTCREEVFCYTPKCLETPPPPFRYPPLNPEIWESLIDDIEQHMENRLQIFLQQIILVHGTGLRFENCKHADDQAGKGAGDYVAAHSGLLPSLRIPSESAIGSSVSLGYHGSFYWTWNATMILPRLVNSVDITLETQIRDIATGILNTSASAASCPREQFTTFLRSLARCTAISFPTTDETKKIYTAYAKVTQYYLENIRDIIFRVFPKYSPEHISTTIFKALRCPVPEVDKVISQIVEHSDGSIHHITSEIVRHTLRTFSTTSAKSGGEDFSRRTKVVIAKIARSLPTGDTAVELLSTPLIVSETDDIDWIISEIVKCYLTPNTFYSVTQQSMHQQFTKEMSVPAVAKEIKWPEKIDLRHLQNEIYKKMTAAKPISDVARQHVALCREDADARNAGAVYLAHLYSNITSLSSFPSTREDRLLLEKLKQTICKLRSQKTVQKIKIIAFAFLIAVAHDFCSQHPQILEQESSPLDYLRPCSSLSGKALDYFRTCIVDPSVQILAQDVLVHLSVLKKEVREQELSELDRIRPRVDALPCFLSYDIWKLKNKVCETIARRGPAFPQKIADILREIIYDIWNRDRKESTTDS